MTAERIGTEDETPSRTGEAMRVRLPGFILGDDIGLGDALRRVTYAFGVPACGGCERRAAALNRWMVFTR
jgi:hypothetical protein